jgi:hypothetical protein
MIMRTVVMALAAIAMLAAPALSQERGGTGKPSGAEQQSAEQKMKSASSSEKPYKAAQSADTGFDPWRKMR